MLDLTQPHFTDGATTITVAAVDRAGNSTTVERGILIDHTPPVLSNAHFENETTQNITWIRNGDDVRLRVEFSDDNLTTSNLFANLQAFGRSTTETADSINASMAEWRLGEVPTTLQPMAKLLLNFGRLNPAGNRSEGITTASTTADNTSPEIEITEPGTTVTTRNTILRGRITDALPGSVSAAYYVLDNDSSVSLTIDPSTGEYSASLYGLGDGSHTITVYARDLAQNTSELGHTFAVDTVPCLMNLSLMDFTINSSEFSRNGDLIFATLKYTGNDILQEYAIPDFSDFRGTSVTLPTESGIMWILHPDYPTSCGVATARVSALDKYGRLTTATASIGIDNVAPWAEFIDHVPERINYTTVTLSGIAFDTSPGRISRIEYQKDEDDWTTTELTSEPYDDASTETFRINIQGLEDGLHTLKTRVTDRAGNLQSDGFASQTFTVDTINPRIASLEIDDSNTTSTSISGTEREAYVKNNDSVVVTAYMSDFSDGDLILADLTTLGGSALATPTTVTNGVATWQIAAASTASDGRSTVTVVVSDGASTDSMQVSFLADNKPPSSTIAANGPNPSPFIHPSVGGTASDESPGMILMVEVRVDGSEWQNAWPAGEGRFGLNPNNYVMPDSVVLTSGTHIIETRAIDYAGNVESAPYPSLSLTVAPWVEYVNLVNLTLNNPDKIEASHVFRNGDDLRLTAQLNSSMTLPSSASLHADLSFFGLGSDVAPTTMVESVAQWNYTTVQASPADGPIFARVWADDPLSSVSALITADNTSPTIHLYAPPADPIRGHEVLLTGDAQDTGSGVDRVTYIVDGVTTGESSARLGQSNGNGVKEFLLDAHDLANGSHTINAIVYDLAGNRQTVFQTFMVDDSVNYLNNVLLRDEDINSTTVIRNGHRAEISVTLADPYLWQGDLHADLSQLSNDPEAADATPGEYDNITAVWHVNDVITSPTDGPICVPVWITIDGESTGTVHGYITADNTSPSVAFTSSTMGLWHNSSVTVMWETADQDLASSAGLAVWHAPGLSGEGTTFTLHCGDTLTSEGIYSLTAWGWDVAGNIGQTTTTTLRVDLTSPMATLNPFVPDRQSVQDIITTGTAWDANGSGIAQIEYSLDGESWLALSQDQITTGVDPNDSTKMNYFVALQNVAEGNHTLYARVTDVASNHQSPPASTPFTIDRTGPEISITQPTSGTWQNTPVMVQWSSLASDLATSTGQALYRETSSSDPTTLTIYCGDTLTSEGLYDLSAWALDDLGNRGEVQSKSFGIDLTSPTVTLNPFVPSMQSITDAVTTGCAWDTNGSGISRIDYRLDNDQWQTVASDQITTGMDPSDPTKQNYTVRVMNISETTHTLSIRVADFAGNAQSPLASTEFAVDRTGPAITILSPNAGVTLTTTTQLGVFVTDALAGINSVDFMVNQTGEQWSNFTSIIGNSYATTRTASLDITKLYDAPSSLTFRAIDAIGNVSQVYRDVTINNDLPPLAPTGLSASYISYSEVQLNWNLNTEPDFDEYRVYRNTTSTVTTANRIASDQEITTGTLIDTVTSTTARPGYYYYMVQSADLVGNLSLPSDSIPVASPDAPKNLIAVGRNQQVDLSWDSVKEGFVKGYAIYRADNLTTFTCIGLTDSRTATTYTDTSTTNGRIFYYFVLGRDGAENVSTESNIVSATPNTVSAINDACMVTFEDLKGQGNTDWDFNDITVLTTTTMFLNANDCVSTISYTAKGIIKDAGYTHEVRLDIPGLVGTAHVDIYRYDVGHLNSTSDIQTNVLYQHGVTAPILVIPNTTDGVATSTSHNAGVVGDIVKVTVRIDSPSSNSFATFDKPPFDTWIHVRDTSANIHIFDPLTGDYAEDNQQVINDSDLEGVYLTFGLKIPKLDWAPPSTGQKIWAKYPEFIDYAKTMRTSLIKNPSWYNN